jgi:hypothetical protein
MNARGVPDTFVTLAFMTGAVMGFAFVGVLAFGGLTKRFDRERGQALLWGSFHFFSVGLAIEVAALVTYYVQSSIPGPWRPSCQRLSTFSSWERSPPPRTHGTIGRKTERTGQPAQTHLHQKAPLLVRGDDRDGIQLQHLLR